MDKHHFLGFDLGAESGRAILGTLCNGKLELKEIHRFANGFQNIRGRLHWNIFRLFEEMKKALQICVKQEKIQPDAMAFDTWGVDFGLLAADGSFLGLPLSYRDHHTDTAIAEFAQKVSQKRVFELTGIAFWQFNTLYQLYALKRDKSLQLDVATDLLFMPDIFNYLFTGIKKTEFTFATTSQLFSPVNKAWEAELFDILGVSQSIMQEVVAPGTIIGQIDDAVCKELDIKTMPVIAVASHDTGSAIASVPAEGENWAYISSGTWSLMGIESKVPIISTEAMDANFTNEGGVENTFRFLKNIMGLWLLQQSRKAWSKTNEYSYSEMVEMAKAAQPFKAFVNPDCTDFYNPDDMPAAIVNHCMQTNQTADLSHGEIIRTILESLALKYRYTVDQLKQVTGKKIDRIHIIGGGTQNRLLSQFTANATGLEVVAGPVEATVVGNIMMQAFALGKVDSLAEMRQIIRHSFDCEVFIPEQTVEWDEAYQKFLTIV